MNATCPLPPSFTRVFTTTIHHHLRNPERHDLANYRLQILIRWTTYGIFFDSGSLVVHATFQYLKSKRVITPVPLHFNHFHYIYYITILIQPLSIMPLSHQLSSSLLSLQVPNNNSLPSSARRSTLRPPSPARKEPGFVVPPNDSRTSLLTPDHATGSDASGPLANRCASPRPPTLTKKKASKKAPAPSQTKVKPNKKGKVSLFVITITLYSDRTNIQFLIDLFVK